MIHNANIDMIPRGLMEIPQDLLGVFRLSRQEQMAYDHPRCISPVSGSMTDLRPAGTFPQWQRRQSQK